MTKVALKFHDHYIIQSQGKFLINCMNIKKDYLDLEYNYPAEYSRDLVKICGKCNVYLLVANYEKFANLCQW